MEHAEVKASTRVVALRIFMSQMDFSKVNDSFLNRLSNLSSVKPLSLERLSERAKNEKGWEEYRSTLMTFIDKMKWPVWCLDLVARASSMNWQNRMVYCRLNCRVVCTSVAHDIHTIHSYMYVMCMNVHMYRLYT